MTKGQLPPRLHAHADMDVLTLLYQREGALPIEALLPIYHIYRLRSMPDAIRLALHP